MDNNYLYMNALLEKEDYNNAEGGWFKGLFSTENQEGEQEFDHEKAVNAGMSILNLAGTWLSNRNARMERPSYTPPPPPPPKNNTLLYVVSGLAVVGVGVGIYFATKK